jgi:predicted SAM-dependent methyltransferase
MPLPYRLRRKLGLVDRQILRSYLSQYAIRKLHIGCGYNMLGGWLNSDYCPRSAMVMRLDATRRFPFDNDQFQYVFSEHMIEHVSYTRGLLMLAECFRIMTKDGKIRISTPNLSFLMDLYKDEKTDLQERYIKWATDSFIKEAPAYDDTFVINNFVRDWGHLFIYDEKILRLSLEKVGFT